MLHHILEGSDIFKNCVYCKKEIDPTLWKSEFLKNTHYKEALCPNCRSKNTVKVYHASSGAFDKWPRDLTTRELEKTVTSEIRHKRGIHKEDS